MSEDFEIMTETIRQRIDRLERENARLKRALEMIAEQGTAIFDGVIIVPVKTFAAGVLEVLK